MEKGLVLLAFSSGVSTDWEIDILGVLCYLY